MILDEIPSGESIFIDSNIFIYHFTGVSDHCTDFLTRCESGDLNGVSSVNVLLEVLHRLMLIEVVKKNLLDPPNLVRKLQEKPGIVKQLNEYFINTQKIPEMGINIKSLSNDIIYSSHHIRTNYGLLVNDSVIVASLQAYNLKNLASNDRGIKIENIHIYHPADINL